MAKGWKTGGRAAGTPNKRTEKVSQALHEAFEELGGVVALVKWAKVNPNEFYRIWSRMLPKESGIQEESHPQSTVVIYLPDDGRDPEVTAQLLLGRHNRN